MSLFTVGKRYQGEYTVEHVVNFFDGQLAIANFLDERYYLQSVPLIREFTTLEFHRFKKLYDELDLELLLPVSDMFLEGDHAVFVYPYEPIQPIRDIVTGSGVSDEEIVGWFQQIVETEIALQSMGIPMYMIRDPRNIGLNTNRELRVIFTGIEDVMLTESTINWGTFFYCVASGEYVEESLKRLPSKHSLSKPVARLVQKSFRAKSLEDLQTIIEQGMKKIQGGGLIESIFGKKKKTEPTQPESSPELTSDSLTIDSTSSQPKEQPQQDYQDLQLEGNLNDQKNTVDWSQAIEQTEEKNEQDYSQTTQGSAMQEPDPFHQQLEEMYQALEQENQSDQQSMDHTKTQIFTNENPSLDPTSEQQNDTTKQQSFDDLQLSNTQVLDAEQLNAALMETQTQDTAEPKMSENAKQTTTQDQSQDADNQIFSASDLSSIEAELKELEQNIQSEKEQAQKEPEGPESSKQETESLEQTTVQPAADDLEQLEELFSELNQLQEQPANTSEQQNEQIQQVEEQPEQNTSQEQTLSDLDEKMKEIENLFDELNQGQIQTNSVSVTEEAETTQGSVKVETPREEQVVKAEEIAASALVEEAVEEQVTAKEEKVKEPVKDEHVPIEEAVTEEEPEDPEDPLEKLRIEFEQEQKKLLERQQQRLKERQQALIVEVQEELKRRQEELLREIEEQEEKMLLELEEEFQRRKLEEMRKIELNTLRKKHEKDVKSGLEEIRRKYQEKEEKELKQLEKEYHHRREEIINQYREQRRKEEEEFKAKKAKEWEEVMKKFNESDADDEKEQTGQQDKQQKTVEGKKTKTEKKEKSQKRTGKKTKEAKKRNPSQKKTSAKGKEEKTNDNESTSQSDQSKQANKEVSAEEAK